VGFGVQDSGSGIGEFHRLLQAAPHTREGCGQQADRRFLLLEELRDGVRGYRGGDEIKRDEGSAKATARDGRKTSEAPTALRIGGATGTETIWPSMISSCCPPKLREPRTLAMAYYCMR